jgi:hypothetical protein
MTQEANRKGKQTRQSSLQEGGFEERIAGHDESRVRLPIQAAPVRRTGNPSGPFKLEIRPEAVCQILSPYAATQCLGAGQHHPNSWEHPGA